MLKTSVYFALESTLHIRAKEKENNNTPKGAENEKPRASSSKENAISLCWLENN